ncbi:flagellar hook-associated protein FlgL [Balneolaceae bacterium]|nr:flagellar hook-associated protein FlgL [Balneolaceae bacterium]
MRITQQTIFDGFMKHINENRAEMHDLQQDIASGKKITKASDDPLKFKKARLLENQIREQEVYQDRIGAAKNTLDLAEQSLQEIVNGLIEIKSNVTRAVNGTHDSASFTAIKQELESLKEELVSSFNAKDINGYIFGGAGSDSLPFSIDANTGSVTFNGSNDALSLKVDSNLSIDVTQDGNFVRTTNYEDDLASNPNSYRSYITPTLLDDQGNTATGDTAFTSLQAVDNYLEGFDNLELDITLPDGSSPPIMYNYRTNDTVNDMISAFNTQLDPLDVTMTFENGSVFVKSKSMGPNGLNVNGFTDNGNNVFTTNFPAFTQQASGEVDQGIDLFDSIDEAIVNLENQNVGALSTQIDQFEELISHVTTHITEIGLTNNRLNFLEEKHENSKILLNAELSGWVDTDYAETVSKLQRTEIAFQSAMTIHTKMFNQSLIEYL